MHLKQFLSPFLLTGCLLWLLGCGANGSGVSADTSTSAIELGNTLGGALSPSNPPNGDDPDPGFNNMMASQRIRVDSIIPETKCRQMAEVSIDPSFFSSFSTAINSYVNSSVSFSTWSNFANHWVTENAVEFLEAAQLQAPEPGPLSCYVRTEFQVVFTAGNDEGSGQDPAIAIVEDVSYRRVLCIPDTECLIPVTKPSNN